MNGSEQAGWAIVDGALVEVLTGVSQSHGGPPSRAWIAPDGRVVARGYRTPAEAWRGESIKVLERIYALGEERLALMREAKRMLLESERAAELES